MKALNLLFASVALAAMAGCLPVAHVELADGTLVTFVQGDGDVPAQEERAPDGTVRTVKRLPCDVSPQVGLTGEVVDREWEEPLPDGRSRGVLLKTLRVTNTGDKPLALRRILSYAPASEPPEGVDAATGFTGVTLKDVRMEAVRPETPGFVCRVLPLARPWRIEAGVLIQPLAALSTGEKTYVSIPAALLAPGAEVTVHRLGGGPALATLTPIDPPDRPAPDALLCYAYGPGLPPSLPLELRFRAEPDAPATTGYLLPSNAVDGAPTYALEGVKELNQDLAPGESLDFTVRLVLPAKPVDPGKDSK